MVHGTNPYNHDKAFENHRKHLIEREKTLARTSNPEFKINHAAEVRDATKATPDFTQLELRMNQKLDAHKSKWLARLQKRGMKKRV